jgi:hypothetical protein
MLEDIEKKRIYGSVQPAASIYCSSDWQVLLHRTDADPTDNQVPQRPISVTQPSNPDSIETCV